MFICLPCTLIHISFIFSAFKNQPLTPPSRAQEMIRQGAEDPESSIDFVASIKRLMSNKGYVLLLITYGMNVGVFYAMATLLNTVILKHFPVSFFFLQRSTSFITVHICTRQMSEKY
jgi:FLVCR family feline leukemia virus subgroup C receptor-related protein